MAENVLLNKPLLDIGSEVTSLDGMRYKVTQYLGHGGQGEVYRVAGLDGEFALKWYYPDSFLKRINADAFYKNIRHNVATGVPKLSTGDAAAAFIWQKKLIDWQKGSFGYVMQLFAPRYIGLGDIILGRHINKDGSEKPLYWPSWFTRITAGINLARAFEILHAEGLSYQDLNEGGFAFDMDTGDVQICDCDNVAPDLTNLGILGVLPYMAPEVACGKCRPNQMTDRHSLAVILFRLFFHNHPLEGKRSIALRCDDRYTRRQADMMIYGTDPCYCLERVRKLNPPDAVRHADVCRLIGVYPIPLLQAFERVFTDGLSNPSARLSAAEWRKVLLQTRDLLVKVNGQEQFYYTLNGRRPPDECRQFIYPNGSIVMCMPGKTMYSYHFIEYGTDYNTVQGEITATTQAGVLALYNGTGHSITLTWDGKSRTYNSGSYLPLIPGSELSLNDKLKVKVE